MSEIKFVKVKVVEQEVDGGPFNFGDYEQGSLNLIIDSLITIRKSIPEEYRDIARCEFSSEGSYEIGRYATIEVYYIRPETQSETQTREYKEKLACEAKITHERKEYERLRGKFENK